MTRILTNEAGTTSYELQWSTYDGPAKELGNDSRIFTGKFASYSEEYSDRQDAETRALKVLSAKGIRPSSVSLIQWSHQHNLPNALPLVRAYSISLDSYSLGEGNTLALKAIDIHGCNY